MKSKKNKKYKRSRKKAKKVSEKQVKKVKKVKKTKNLKKHQKGGMDPMQTDGRGAAAEEAQTNQGISDTELFDFMDMTPDILPEGYTQQQAEVFVRPNNKGVFGQPPPLTTDERDRISAIDSEDRRNDAFDELQRRSEAAYERQNPYQSFTNRVGHTQYTDGSLHHTSFSNHPTLLELEHDAQLSGEENIIRAVERDIETLKIQIKEQIEEEKMIEKKIEKIDELLDNQEWAILTGEESPEYEYMVWDGSIVNGNPHIGPPQIRTGPEWEEYYISMIENTKIRIKERKEEKNESKAKYLQKFLDTWIMPKWEELKDQKEAYNNYRMDEQVEDLDLTRENLRRMKPELRRLERSIGQPSRVPQY